MTVEFVEKELTLALFRLSYGRLSAKEAEEKAKEVAPKVVANCELIGHKGLNWYAKQLLAVI